MKSVRHGGNLVMRIMPDGYGDQASQADGSFSIARFQDSKNLSHRKSRAAY